MEKKVILKETQKRFILKALEVVVVAVLVFPALLCMVSPIEGVSFWTEVLIRTVAVVVLVLGGRLMLLIDPSLSDEEV